MQEWVHLMNKNFRFPHIKVIYPTAPLQPYSPAGGQPSNVWFDRADINQNVAEKLDSVERIGVQVKELIKSEVDGGIPLNRIIVGKIAFCCCLLDRLYHLETLLKYFININVYVNSRWIFYGWSTFFVHRLQMGAQPSWCVCIQLFPQQPIFCIPRPQQEFGN